MSDFYTDFKELDLELHGVRLPSFEIEKEIKREVKVSEDLNNYDFLIRRKHRGQKSHCHL